MGSREEHAQTERAFLGGVPILLGMVELFLALSDANDEPWQMTERDEVIAPLPPSSWRRSRVPRETGRAPATCWTDNARDS